MTTDPELCALFALLSLVQRLSSLRTPEYQGTRRRHSPRGCPPRRAMCSTGRGLVALAGETSDAREGHVDEVDHPGEQRRDSRVDGQHRFPPPPDDDDRGGSWETRLRLRRAVTACGQRAFPGAAVGKRQAIEYSNSPARAAL
ncbi:hypothetical protein M430DRAFT_269648 [Amorphotheca resinae ATCC 22711]|uniref:Uncharacterized protein n=1 Tax=Amorphotheca resinae ATCC 22711 TaxID=857342 RepID=A0A2T3BFV3_AMORE|nr:hypothetical protein M430DRAFT_269648 [Amorphotheca resinae ATCC 22711]PSS28254.1 hypothetical protein M430DRAFT_269648 [Amorphotheca resinae ATCC 22711]